MLQLMMNAMLKYMMNACLFAFTLQSYGFAGEGQREGGGFYAESAEKGVFLCLFRAFACVLPAC
jgi:hypothetical protein